MSVIGPEKLALPNPKPSGFQKKRKRTEEEEKLLETSLIDGDDSSWKKRRSVGGASPTAESMVELLVQALHTDVCSSSSLLRIGMDEARRGEGVGACGANQLELFVQTRNQF